jgi:uncharacterized protein YbgA (DUF1722 family)/uncharacterized protein YbbK (DUF523 family)
MAVRIGISACLLGQEVRFDGGHKRDRFLTDTFGRFVEWVAVCPEVEAGFGTPREAMRLVDVDGRLRLLTVRTHADLTDRLDRYAERRVDELGVEDLSGYVLKSDSPSCGLERVKVYGRSTAPKRTGTGLFAGQLRRRFPFLPLEEEGRLADPRLRENFVERVFAYRRARDLFESRWTPAGLVAFHTAHKLTLMAHSPVAYRSLGRLVARRQRLPPRELEARYFEGFMGALATIATPPRHANVLQHMAGYFKKLLDRREKTELAETIDDYRIGLTPLVVPMTLIRHYVRRYDVVYLSQQVYLEPHPKELMLRNHV